MSLPTQDLQILGWQTISDHPKNVVLSMCNKLFLPILVLALGPLWPIDADGQSAFSGIFTKNSSPQVRLFAASWEELLQQHREFADEGFGMIDLEVFVEAGDARYFGIWREGAAEHSLEIERIEGWEAMLARKKEKEAEEHTLEDLEVYTDQEGKTVFVGIWSDRKRPHKMWKLTSPAALEKQAELLAESYFYPADAEVLVMPGMGPQFFLLYHRNAPNQRTYLTVRTNEKAFFKDRFQRLKSGYRCLDYESTASGGINFHLGIYQKGEVASACQDRLNWESFIAYQEYLGEDYQLADLELSAQPGKRLAPPALLNRLRQTPAVSVSTLNGGIKAGAAPATQSGAAAAANALTWLSQQGYDRLNFKSRARAESTQRDIAGQLMGSAPGHHQTSLQLIRDIRKFIEDRNYTVAELVCQDITTASRKTQKAAADSLGMRLQHPSDRPSLKALKAGLVGNSMVLIRWSVYHKPADSIHFRRVGASWGNVLGYGKNKYGVEQAETIVLHAPDRGTGQHYLKVDELEDQVVVAREAVLRNTDHSLPAPRRAVFRGLLHDEAQYFAVWDQLLIIRLE